MRLGWYINRLRSMEPAEILHRLAEKGRRLQSRHRHEGWHRYAARELTPVFPGVRARVAAATSAQQAAIAEAAEAILAGGFAALGRNWPAAAPDALFSAERWRLDPVTGQLWPGADAYTFDIDFRHARAIGDIKYVWEFNRLQMLPVLAAHNVLTGDARALTAIDAAIISWHAANPPFRGVGWASGIEVALRAISLLLVVDLLGDRLEAGARRCIGEIVAATAFWLPRFPSRFSSANNHLVAELAGEYLVVLALGGDAGRVGERLELEIERQILPDGAGAEQSPTYAAFTAELVLFCVLASRHGDNALAGSALERLAAFVEHVRWLGPPGTRAGDDDEGRVVSNGVETDYPGSVAAAVAAVLGTPGPAADDVGFRPLLFGTATPALEPEGLRIFRAGGLTVWRGKLGRHDATFTFDHGPLGYLSIAAHGHADALSISLSLDGRPLLVDPGTYLYGSGGEWRTWFRSTPAHNTLNLDGASQSLPSGPFNWSHKAATILLEASEEPDWRVTAEHDGYTARFGVRHRRIVSGAGERIVITDRLMGGRREAEIVFQLAAGLSARSSDNVVTISRQDEPVLRLHLPEGSLTIAAGGDQPGTGGWVSPRFGEKLPAPRIAWRGNVDEAGVVTELVPVAS